MSDWRERHFDKLLTTACLVFIIAVFLFMWRLGANEQLLDKIFGLVMLFAGLLAGLIQGARNATRVSDQAGNVTSTGAPAPNP